MLTQDNPIETALSVPQAESPRILLSDHTLESLDSIYYFQESLLNKYQSNSVYNHLTRTMNNQLLERPKESRQCHSVSSGKFSWSRIIVHNSRFQDGAGTSNSDSIRLFKVKVICILAAYMGNISHNLAPFAEC